MFIIKGPNLSGPNFLGPDLPGPDLPRIHSHHTHSVYSLGTLWDHSEIPLSTLRLRGHPEITITGSTQRTIRYHLENTITGSTQRLLREHSVNSQTTLRYHSEIAQRTLSSLLELTHVPGGWSAITILNTFSVQVQLNRLPGSLSFISSQLWHSSFHIVSTVSSVNIFSSLSTHSGPLSNSLQVASMTLWAVFPVAHVPVQIVLISLLSSSPRTWTVPFLSWKIIKSQHPIQITIL